MLKVCSLHNVMIEKLLAPLSIEACTHHVHFSDRHPVEALLLSTLVCSSSTFFMITNSLSMSRKCALSKVLPESKLNFLWSSGRVTLQPNRLVLELFYNTRMYLVAHITKGLEIVIRGKFFVASKL